MQIETKRLILRDWKIEDADAVVDALNNYEVAKNHGCSYPYKKEEAVELIESSKEWNVKNKYSFAIVRKSDNVVIGGESLKKKINEDYLNGGLFLHQKYHGMGYGKEAWTAIIKLWFEDENNKFVNSGYYEFNDVSEKLHNKMGFKVFAKRGLMCPALKKEVDVVCVRLTREDFEKYYNSIDFEFKITK